MREGDSWKTRFWGHSRKKPSPVTISSSFFGVAAVAP
jgi:hypothetical protein